MTALTPYKSLMKNGFIVEPSALQPTLLDRFRVECMSVVGAAKDSPLLADGTARTLAVDMESDIYHSIVKIGADILARYEFRGVKYLAGAIIPKYPGEGRRFWHTDWWDWDDPDATGRMPSQIGILFYLDSTHEHSALSAVPGSHHGGIRGIANSLGKFEPRHDEKFVRLDAGDAVVFDARLVHAVEGNTSKEKIRVAVAVWYLVDWGSLSEQIKSSAMLCMSPDFEKKLGSLYPNYTGTLPPKPHNKANIARLRAFHGD